MTIIGRPVVTADELKERLMPETREQKRRLDASDKKSAQRAQGQDKGAGWERLAHHHAEPVLTGQKASWLAAEVVRCLV